MKPLSVSLVSLFLAVTACGRETPTAPRAQSPAPPAFAVVFHADSVTASRKAFNSIAGIYEHGRFLAMSGPVQCLPVGQRAQFAVTVAQSSTGAVATGSFTVTCSGEPQQWQTTAHAAGPARFTPGTANACGALTNAFGQTAGRESWCREITLQ